MTDLILAVDVQYDDARATGRVGGLWFADWADPIATHEAVVDVTDVAPYQPGHFYKRELPCIEAIMGHGPQPRLIVVDGYVDLGPARPGLGRYLHDACGLPVIGVAKTRFRSAAPAEVLRGASARPLYVTSAGLDVERAADAIGRMAGPHRMPDLLKRVDQLARGLVSPVSPATPA